MKHSAQIKKTFVYDVGKGTYTFTTKGYNNIVTEAKQLEKKIKAARAIMQRFVDKVDSGRARSTETYAEMKEWLDD